uniref:Uncharacterized protein n=1 Tax=Avena sativa TaxID=4498 RepID=A0ACD5YXK4_AVESA
MKGLLSRRRRQRPARDEDRLSDLPDDLLLHILGRLDTRSALGAAALSRRWAHLPRELSALNLKVTDALPPRYRRCLDLLHEARHSNGPCESGRRLETVAGRYERRAMRAMVSSVRSLRSSRAHRRVRRLSLEIFEFSTSASINRLVVNTVDSWRVEDLEVVATRQVHGADRASASGLQVPPWPHPQEARRVPSPKPQARQLLAPAARGVHRAHHAELVVDGELTAVKLRSLPKLESLTAVDANVLLCSDAVPCLAHVSLVFSICPLDYSILNHLISMFMLVLEDAVSIRNLVLRFTGPEMWIARNKNPFPRMPNLKKLLVADVPSSWDVSWPHAIIQAAPQLESLHVHVSQCQEEEGEPGQHTSYAQPLASQRHSHLKELVVIGFGRTSTQLIQLVRFAVDTSTALSHVALLKHGHVEIKGPWEWEMMSQQSTWSNEEKLAVLDGIQCSTSRIELVLG